MTNILPTNDPEEIVYYDLDTQEATLLCGAVIPITNLFDLDGDEVELDADLSDYNKLTMICGPTPSGLWISTRIERGPPTYH